MAAAGREARIVTSSPSRLSDGVYPPGGTVPAKLTPEATRLQTRLDPIAERAAPRVLSGSRFAQVLDPVGLGVQARGFDLAFGYIAERWRRDETMLRERYGDLDRAFDADLATRDPFGSPKEGTAFGDLDPKLRDRMRDDFALNYRTKGFASAQEATDWLATARVDRVVRRDFVGFGVRGLGPGSRRAVRSGPSLRAVESPSNSQSTGKLKVAGGSQR